MTEECIKELRYYTHGALRQLVPGDQVRIIEVDQSGKVLMDSVLPLKRQIVEDNRRMLSFAAEHKEQPKAFFLTVDNQAPEHDKVSFLDIESFQEAIIKVRTSVYFVRTPDKWSLDLPTEHGHAEYTLDQRVRMLSYLIDHADEYNSPKGPIETKRHEQELLWRQQHHDALVKLQQLQVVK